MAKCIHHSHRCQYILVSVYVHNACQCLYQCETAGCEARTEITQIKESNYLQYSATQLKRCTTSSATNNIVHSQYVIWFRQYRINQHTDKQTSNDGEIQVHVNDRTVHLVEYWSIHFRLHL